MVSGCSPAVYSELTITSAGLSVVVAMQACPYLCGDHDGGGIDIIHHNSTISSQKGQLEISKQSSKFVE
jgi:hypothetical protein